MILTKNKIILSSLGTALTAGVVLASTNYSKSNETIPSKINDEKRTTKTKIKLKAKYGVSLINGEGNFWSSRFQELKNGNPKHEDLKKLKELKMDEGLEKLEEVCEDISDYDEESEWFEDFQNFCTMKNKDGSRVIGNKNGFNAKYSSFSGAKRSSLSEKFASIWDQKGNSASEEWKQKMLDECQRLKNKMYVDDTEDNNFTAYCTN